MKSENSPFQKVPLVGMPHMDFESNLVCRNSGSLVLGNRIDRARGKNQCEKYLRDSFIA
jgi:hypothetical protein